MESKAPAEPRSILPEGSFRQLLGLGVLLPILLLVAFASVILLNGSKLNQLRQAAADEQRAVSDARIARTSLLDMETGWRGYLLTGDPSYLEPYRSGSSDIAGELDRMVQDSFPGTQHDQAPTIQALAREWIAVAKDSIAKKERHAASARYLAMGKTIFDALRQQYDDYISRGETRIAKLLAESESRRVYNTTFLIVGAILVGVALALSSTALFRRVSNVYHSALEAYQAESAAAEQASELYRLVTERAGDLIFQLDKDRVFTYASPSFERVLGYKPTELVGTSYYDILHPKDVEKAAERRKLLDEEGVLNLLVRLRSKRGDYEWIEATATATPAGLIMVGRDVTERIASEQQIRTLNTELEERVTERTADLASANRELEAFSYSVSHDLRAPLRSIASFSTILEQDLAGKLDAESTDNLMRIRAAAMKMTALIDALLRFSRIARAEVSRSEVDISGLAQSIVDELRRVDPKRKVEVQIQPGLADQADPNLLRLVLENLLENAWKFTSHKEEAHISFGRQADGTYFVKDDGAGFEKEFVAKVFLPFERLHKEADFPGTGIGLATTKRIIDRHGGKIWAHGEPGKGAQFFFTLH